MNHKKGYNMLRQEQRTKFISEDIKNKISKSQKLRLSLLTAEEKSVIYAKCSKSHQGMKKGKNNLYVEVNKLIDRRTKHKYFVTQIIYKNKNYRKLYKNEKEAARAYDKMALYLYGQEALTNFNKKKL